MVKFGARSALTNTAMQYCTDVKKPTYLQICGLITVQVATLGQVLWWSSFYVLSTGEPR